MNQCSEETALALSAQASNEINQKRRDSIAEALASGLTMEELLRRAFASIEVEKRESPLVLHF